MGYSFELVRKRFLRRLAGQPGWLAFGFAGGLVALCFLITRPVEFYDGVASVRKAAMWLAAWLLAYTEFYLIATWLAPHAKEEDAGLAHLPLPPGQHFIHRLLDLGGVPLVNLVLCLPLFWVALVYYGFPYGESSDVNWRVNMVNYPYWAGWDLAHDPQPWLMRVLLICVNLAVAVLLPLAVGALLDLALPWAAVRIPVLLGLSLGSYFLIRTYQVRYELFRIAYQQGRGYAAWTFIAVGLALVVTPFLVARLSQRGRLALAALAAVVLCVGVGLVFAQHQLPGEHTTTTIRKALGDLRFALAYFFCHLSPAENIDLLCFNYPTNVLFNDAYAHNLIPRHLALWVGAGLYPPLWCLAALTGMWLGVSTRGRRQEE